MSYETDQRSAIDAWRTRSPGLLSVWWEKSLTPVTRLVNMVVPESALHAALEGACALGEWLTSPESVLQQSGMPQIAALRDCPLEVCDTLADTVHDRAVAMAAAEGGLTGATGLIGVAVDIPGLMTLSLRTIYQTGLCYGFELKGDEGRRLALRIFSLASANSLKEKEAALISLVAIRQMLTQQSWAQIQQAATVTLGREAMMVAVRDVAKQLGINLTKRKALNIVPVIGAAVGAAINAAFVNDVGWAARRSFQELWLAQQFETPLCGQAPLLPGQGT